MSALSEYFLNSASNVVRLETLDISHPNFSKTYRVVRNAVRGLTATLEDASQATFDYYPLKIVPTGNADDLDQTLQVTLGDLGQLIPQELDNINLANSFGTKPVMKYRSYRSDDLSAPLDGPISFEVAHLSTTSEGAVLAAEAHRANYNTTGEGYTTDMFPMLVGFL